MSVRINLLHRAEVAVCNIQLTIGCVELKTVPNGELSLDLAIRADAMEP